MGLIVQKYRLQVVFTTPPLGTQPGKDTVASDFLRKRAEENGVTVEVLEQDQEGLPEIVERGTTGFYRMPGTDEPAVAAYQLKGYLKEWAAGMNGKQFAEGVPIVKNFKSKVERAVFPMPRMVPMILPAGGAMTYCERPLRALTAQGPRTALMRSEELPIGTSFSMEVHALVGEINEPVLRALLDLGEYQGMLQWRGGDRGRFSYTLERF